MTTVKPGATSALNGRVCQCSAFDLCVLMIVCVIAITGAIEIYKSLPTHHNPNSSVVSEISTATTLATVRSTKSESSMRIGGDSQFADYWLRRFSASLCFLAFVILGAFLSPVFLCKTETQLVPRIKPGLASTLGCIVGLIALTFSAYETRPHWNEVDGQWLNEPIAAGLRALAPAFVVMLVVAGIEFARFRRRGNRFDSESESSESVA